MTVTRKYNIEIEITVDDEDSDMLEKLDDMYESGRMKSAATYLASVASSFEGYNSMPRAILARQGIIYDKGFNTDHIDKNNGNNTRNNLRVITASANQKNKNNSSENQSRYIGVYWHKNKKTWQAQVPTKVNGKNKTYGRGKKSWHEIDAAIWYDTKVRELGLNKPLNFSDDELARLIEQQSAKAA